MKNQLYKRTCLAITCLVTCLVISLCFTLQAFSLTINGTTDVGSVDKLLYKADLSDSKPDTETAWVKKVLGFDVTFS